MCGIGLLALFPNADHAETHDALLTDDWNRRLSETLASRGPDIPCRQRHFSPDNINFIENNDVAGPTTPTRPAAETQWSVTLHASVLHMRGQHPVAQPVAFPIVSSVLDDDDDNDDGQNARNCALCWNGECYAYEKIQGEDDDCTSTSTSTECEQQNHVRLGAIDELISTTIAEEISDTVLVTKLLQEAIAKSQHSGIDEHVAIANAISRIHGEYSFILFVPSPSSKVEVSSATESNENNGTESTKENCHCQSRQGHYYYGRDWLGRRSLLVNKSWPGVVALSSVATDDSKLNNINAKWEEILPGKVFKVDACTGKEACMTIPRVVNKDTPGIAMPPIETLEKGALNCTLDPSVIHGVQAEIRTNTDDAAAYLLKLLDKAVKRRVMHAPLPKSQSAHDASVAVLFSGGIDSVVLAALSHRHIPPNQPIDLINVSFYNDADIGNSARPSSPDRLAAILSYHEMLHRFPGRRWRFIAVDVPYREVLDQEDRVRRLISPLDSTMDFNIATAFWFAGRGRGRVLGMNDVEEARKGLESKSGAQSKMASSASSQEPLLRFANGDSSRNGKESSTTRVTCIREGCTRLAPPSGCVFHACKFCCGKLQGPISSYLGRSARLCPAHNCNNGKTNKNAAKKGTLRAKAKKDPLDEVGHSTKSVNGDETINCTMTSSAKILLSGVGADEQMAGYGRHRTTYQRGGYGALRAELEIEVNRLWTRTQSWQRR